MNKASRKAISNARRAIVMRAAGVSVDEIARRLEVTTRQVRRYFDGRYLPFSKVRCEACEGAGYHIVWEGSSDDAAGCEG